MLSEVAKGLYGAIQNAISATYPTTLVWHEDRPQGEAPSYVTFSVDTSLTGQGSAPIRELTAEVYCYGQSQAVATGLAELIRASLEDATIISNGIRVTGLASSGSQRDFDPDTKQWTVSLRFGGLVVGI